jgi:thiol-disulfide isomerase/thioredoxin
MKIQKRLYAMPVVLVALFPIFAAAGGPARADKPAAETVEQAYPGLATGVLKSGRLTDMEKDIVLKAYQIEIKSDFAKEMRTQAPPEMRKELERHLFFLLEQKATELLIKQDAVSMGISADQSNDAMLKAYVERLTAGHKVNEAEVKAFYEANKEMMGGQPFDQVKGSIEPFLLEQKKAEAIDAHLENLSKRTDIQLNRDWVKQQAKTAMDNPVDKARMSGKPTMVEFGAAGCVPCDMMQPILEKLKRKFPDTLNVIFVHVGENQLMGARFGIRSIPVQAFFDKDGQEVFRHTGFFAEKDVLEQLAKMGVK